MNNKDLDKLTDYVERLRKRNNALEQVINSAYNKLITCNVDDAINELKPYLPDSLD